MPVGVAALIGFGASLSGVAGGLSAVTTGPEAAPASDASPTLSTAVASTARGSNLRPADSGSTTTIGAGGDGASDLGISPTGSAGGTGDESGPGGGTVETPSTPGLPEILGGGGGGGGGGGENPGDTVNGIGNGVNDALGGVNNAVGGLLGK